MSRYAVKTWSTPVTPQKSLSKNPCPLCGSLRFKPGLVCEGFSYIRCARCGLARIHPQPLADEVETRYRLKFGADYFAYELANEGNFLRLQEQALWDAGFLDLERRLFAETGSAAPPRVLDIGCATGALLETLRDRGWDTGGVEICLPSAEYAKTTRGLAIYRRPLAENRFPSGSFDVVMASHLIEHLNDPAGFARESRRILKVGGYFLITTPNIAGFQARVFKHRWRSAIFDHLYLFSIKTLSKLLVISGFTVEKVITWGGLASGTAPAPVKRLFDKAAKVFGFGDVMLIKARPTPTDTRRAPEGGFNKYRTSGRVFF